MRIRQFHPDDSDGVIALWQACGLVKPWNDPEKDIHRKLKVGPELFLVGSLDDALIGSVMGGYEGHRGWINYLAVSPACRGKGYGRDLMEAVESLLLDMGCPKINLQVRTTNAAVRAFYAHIGFIEDEATSFGKRLISDSPEDG